MNSTDDPIQPIKSRGLELAAVVVFVVVNLFAPLVVSEMYPFAISPMFCDQPSQYCTYQLFDEAGNGIDSEDFGLHMVYDGNLQGWGWGLSLLNSCMALVKCQSLRKSWNMYETRLRRLVPGTK